MIHTYLLAQAILLAPVTTQRTTLPSKHSHTTTHKNNHLLQQQRASSSNAPALKATPSALGNNALSTVELRLTHAAQTSRHPSAEKTLHDFMVELCPMSLGRSLQNNLPANMPLSAQVVDGVLLVELNRCLSFGPKAWGLKTQPRIVMWLRKKGRAIVAEGHVCGVDTSAVRLSQLDFKTRCTWVEESIAHLEGDCAPVLLLHTDLAATLETAPVPDGARRGPLRRARDALLLKLARHRLLGEFRVLQGAVASSIVAEYESCRKEWMEGKAS